MQHSTLESAMGPARAIVDQGIGLLAHRIALHIESLVPQGRARCLDVGCGDMTLAEAIDERASRTDWRCIDVHRLPAELHDDTRWSKYRRFDGRTIPYGDGEFDVALLCDVLHLAPEGAAGLLAEAGRVARCVVVKDGFEDRPRRSEVPERCFTRDAFVRTAVERGLVITALDCELDLDESSSGSYRPFIAVLRRA